MITLETPRLLLRNCRMDDIDDYFAYMSLDYTARYEDFDPYTREQCAQAIESRLENDHFIMVALRDGPVIGDVCYSDGEWGNVEIGYDFNRAYEGHGYAAEACQAVLAHLFEVAGARRAVAECNDDNLRSIRLLDRLGFRREAHHIEDVWFKRDAEGNPIYISSYVYALLRREWLAQKEA